jgi:hypothetical protein
MSMSRVVFTSTLLESRPGERGREGGEMRVYGDRYSGREDNGGEGEQKPMKVG